MTLLHDRFVADGCNCILIKQPYICPWTGHIFGRHMILMVGWCWGGRPTA